MKLFKSFAFWFSVVYLLFVLNTFLGTDDKNILIFLSSPVMWLTEQHWFVRLPSAVILICSWLVWLLLGLGLDALKTRIKKRN